MRSTANDGFCIAGLLTMAVILVVAPVPAGATLFTFEPTDPATYVAGETIIGVDRWVDLSGDAGDPTRARATPLPGGESRVISGTQSVVVKARKVGTTTKYKGYVQRPFGPGAPFVDGTTLSWDMIADGNAAGNVLGTYLGNSSTSVYTAAGIQAMMGDFAIDSYFTGFGADTVHGDGVFFSDVSCPCIAGNQYKCEMVLDFTYGGFEAFVTDVTGGGARTSLGKRYFVDTISGVLTPCTPEHLGTVGGMLLTAKNANAVAIFDNLEFPTGIWIPGDASGNGVVDEEDAAILAGNWGEAGGWGDGDFDNDGVVGPADASILAANWHYGATESGTSVPEPSMLVLAAAALLGLAGQRRRE